ncbi:MAG: SRPBCC family protein, partial [Bryobacteraceae bacterium]
MSVAESESVRVTRRLAAAPGHVFHAWTDPALLQRWLAPIAECDPRAGGRFRLEVSKPEGAHLVTGEYREFMPNERLVMTWV